MKKIKLTLGASILLCSSLASATIIEGSFTVDGIYVYESSGLGGTRNNYVANNVLGTFRYDTDYILENTENNDDWTDDSIRYRDYGDEQWVYISLDFGDFSIMNDPFFSGREGMEDSQYFWNIRNNPSAQGSGVYAIGSEGSGTLGTLGTDTYRGTNHNMQLTLFQNTQLLIFEGNPLEYIDIGAEPEFILPYSDSGWGILQMSYFQNQGPDSIANYGLGATSYQGVPTTLITSFEAHVAPIPELPEILLFATGILGLFFARGKLKQGSSPVTS